MTVWKGPFRKGLDPEALHFSSSLAVDRRLYREDIEGSLAHAALLRRAGILRAAEEAAIARGLSSQAPSLYQRRCSLTAMHQSAGRAGAGILPIAGRRCGRQEVPAWPIADRTTHVAF